MQVHHMQPALGHVVGVSLGQVIQYLDVMAQGKQMVRGVRTNVSGAAGDENASHKRKGLDRRAGDPTL